MAELFDSINDLKLYVGGRINQSITLASLDATIYETARRHCVPWLGSELYEELVNNSGLSPEKAALRLLVKRALGPLVVYEYSKVGAVEFGESGIHRVETDTRKSAFRYQEREFKDDALTKGYNAIEEFLQYLDDHKSSFATWVASVEGNAHLSSLLNYARDFRLLALPECDRFTYESIRTIINEVQLFAVQPQLPSAFWSGFISRHQAGTLTSAEKQLRTYLRQSIAHRAITEAVRQRWIKVEGGRISVLEDFGEQRATNMTMPNSTGSGMYISHDISSDRYLAMAFKYIGDNPSSFATVFDVASGGSNTETDAWHINTDDEQAVANAKLDTTNALPIYRM